MLSLLYSQQLPAVLKAKIGAVCSREDRQIRFQQMDEYTASNIFTQSRIENTVWEIWFMTGERRLHVAEMCQYCKFWERGKNGVDGQEELSLRQTALVKKVT